MEMSLYFKYSVFFFFLKEELVSKLLLQNHHCGNGKHVFMKAHEAKKQIWKILPSLNSRNSEPAGWPANHLVILAYCYKLHCSDYSN